MLNLKGDYALGKKGVWRIMGGYEIQHLGYKTFEGTEAEYPPGEVHIAQSLYLL